MILNESIVTEIMCKLSFNLYRPPQGNVENFVNILDIALQSVNYKKGCYSDR